MGISSIVHINNNPKRHLIRQKRVIAPDYPFFQISLWQCDCGCGTYAVSLEKMDIGYLNRLFEIEYNTSLEAFVKFEKFVHKCEEGYYDMCTRIEGEAFE